MPLVGFILVLAVAPRVVRALFPGITSEAVLQLARRPAAPLVLSLALLIAVAIVGAAAFAITVRGFATYRPGTSAR